MATDSVPESLPEDLQPLVTFQRGVDPRISISNSSISMTKAADRLLGEPVRVVVSFGPKSRMLALRPFDQGGSKITRSSKQQTIGILHLFDRLGIPRLTKGKGYRFIPRLVEGCLLIGPFPAADEAGE